MGAPHPGKLDKLSSCLDNLGSVEEIPGVPELNSDSTLPLYAQLADKLTRQIRAGDFASGEKIPSETVLAESYQIGRPTVRQATDLLIRRGYLERRRGSGTYVREPSRHVDLFSLGGTLSSFNKQGIKLSTRMIVAPRLVVAEASDQSEFAGDFYLMERLASVARAPVLLERFRFAADVFPFFDRNKLAGRSLSQVVLERYQMEASSADQSFSVTDLDAKQARLLDLEEGSPVLRVERVLHFPQAMNAVRATMWCRTDKFRFSQKLGA